MGRCTLVTKVITEHQDARGTQGAHSRVLRVPCGEAVDAARTLFLAEVLPSAGFQRHRFIIHPVKSDLPARRNPPDLGERNTRERSGHTSTSGDGEQQFVVFPAMQCQIQINRSRLPDSRVGNAAGVDFGSNATLLTDMSQIRGESIAGVDHGCCKLALAQHASQLDARFRIEMASKVALVCFLSGLPPQLR